MVQVSPRNKWISGILSGTGVGLLAGIMLYGGQSYPCNAEAEAKPLLQNNPAQVVDLADYSPFASEKSVQGKTVAGAEEKRKTISIPEKRQMAMARVYPTIPQIPTRHNTVNNRPEQNASPKHSEPEKNHYSSKIAFIGGEGIEIKNSQGE